MTGLRVWWSRRFSSVFLVSVSLGRFRPKRLSIDRLKRYRMKCSYVKKAENQRSYSRFTKDPSISSFSDVSDLICGSNFNFMDLVSKDFR